MKKKSGRWTKKEIKKKSKNPEGKLKKRKTESKHADGLTA